MRIKAEHVRYLFFIVAIIVGLPIPIPMLSGGLLWISPFMLLNSVLAVKGLVILNLFGFITLIIIFFRYRWICRYACPLGVVCDWASKVRKGKNTIRFDLSKYLAIIALLMAIIGAPVIILLDPFNIFHMSFEGLRTGFGISAFLKILILLLVIIINVIYPNIWCRSICPLGGLQLLTYDIRKIFKKIPGTRKSTINRRSFIISCISGLGAGFILPRLSVFSYDTTIRPPASLPEPDLNLVCARCGNCSNVCPTNIIKQSDDLTWIGRLLTPVIDFTESYCLPDCTLCGDVCPSGAITKFTKDEKKRLFMASVAIDVSKCWLQDQRDCDLCRFHCAFEAIEIKKTGNNSLALPVLAENKCVGCAACKIVCPADAIYVKYHPYTSKINSMSTYNL